MSDNETQLSPTASVSTAAARGIVTGESFRLAKTPTDDHLDTFERLIHDACTKRQRFHADPTLKNARAHRAAVAAMSAHRANIFEGEQVPS